MVDTQRQSVLPSLVQFILTSPTAICELDAPPMPNPYRAEGAGLRLEVKVVALWEGEGEWPVDLLVLGVDGKPIRKDGQGTLTLRGPHDHGVRCYVATVEWARPGVSSIVLLTGEREMAHFDMAFEDSREAK